MIQRTVTDAAGRTWTCTEEVGAAGELATPQQGQDVKVTCVTSSVAEPVHLTMGWQWRDMAPNGLARIISQASPVPRR